MRLPITFAALSTIMLTACQPADPTAQLDRPYKAPSAQCLMQEDWDTPVLWTHSISVTPGEEVTLDPYIRAGPGGRPGKAECLRNIAVLPDAPAPAWSEDGKLVFTVPQDAASSQIYTITATYGSQNIRAAMTVYRPEMQPLVGSWYQKVGCPGREPMRELIFSADGSFRATYTPFETYVDFWGTYSLEPETGLLSLNITGGNNVPGTANDGTIIIQDDTFTLGTASLGAGDGAVCTSPFTRR